MPAFLLNEQMRMPAGMICLSNDLVYSGKLKDGPGTVLQDNDRALALKEYFMKAYPTIKAEPEELMYPVMLNIHGESLVGRNGKSVYNPFNIAATINEIIKLIRDNPDATSCEIGIATPYRAQIRKEEQLGNVQKEGKG